MCSFVICLHWSWWLGVAEFFERVAHGGGSFCIDEEGTKFRLRGGWHGCPYYLRNVEDGSIICWYVVSPCHKHVSSSCMPSVWISMRHCCVSPEPCSLPCIWVLLCPVMPCNLKIAYIAPVFIPLGFACWCWETESARPSPLIPVKSNLSVVPTSPPKGCLADLKVSSCSKIHFLLYL